MYCSNCGVEVLTKGAKFCANCGFDLSNAPQSKPVKAAEVIDLKSEGQAETSQTSAIDISGNRRPPSLTQDSEASAAPQASRRITYASVAMLVISCAVVFVLFSRGNLENDAIEKVTESITRWVLSAAFVSWLLWNYWFQKKRGCGLLAFSFLCALGTAIMLVAVVRPDSQKTNLTKNLASAALTMFDTSNQVSIVPKSTGNAEADKVLRFWAELGIRSNHIFDQMETEL